MDYPTWPVQFELSRVVAEALPIETVASKARAGGMGDARLEYNARHARRGYRVTCKHAMAIHLVERLKVIAGAAETAHDIGLLTACAYDIKAIFDAMEESLKPPTSTGTEPSPY